MSTPRPRVGPATEEQCEVSEMRWLVTTLLLALVKSHTFINVDDSAIMYTGRFDSRVKNIRTFSWPGCQLDVQFWGTKVKAYLSGSYPGAGCDVVFQRLFLTPLTPQLRTPGDRYVVIVDEKQHIIAVESGKETLRLAPAGQHGDAEPVPRVWRWVTLAHGLTRGTHTVKLWKVSEANWVGEFPWQYGAAAFGGFKTDGTFLAPPPKLDR